MIRISHMDNGSKRQLLVEGTLSGGWVDALEATWLETQSERDGKRFYIDLSGVTYIDDKGRELLARIIRGGTELRGLGIMTKVVVEKITKEVEGKQTNGDVGRPSGRRKAASKRKPTARNLR